MEKLTGNLVEGLVIDLPLLARAREELVDFSEPEDENESRYEERLKIVAKRRLALSIMAANKLEVPFESRVIPVKMTWIPSRIS